MNDPDAAAHRALILAEGLHTASARAVDDALNEAHEAMAALEAAQANALRAKRMLNYWCARAERAAYLLAQARGIAEVDPCYACAPPMPLVRGDKEEYGPPWE